jgi:hypothetical protein
VQKSAVPGKKISLICLAKSRVSTFVRSIANKDITTTEICLHVDMGAKGLGVVGSLDVVERALHHAIGSCV